MASNKNTVYIAKTMSDVMFHIKTVPNLAILGGCTSVNEWPASSLVIRNINDFKQIGLHEHYAEFGSAVTLSQIHALGQKRIPSVLYEAIDTIANPFVRNIATIGGNICAGGIKHTLFSPLLALDAQLEIISLTDAQYIPFSKFVIVPEKCILSRVRVPLTDWEVAVFKRLGPEHQLTDESATFTFLATTQKGVLSDLRITFCSSIVLRSRELENTIIGSRLPLSEKAIDLVAEKANELYDGAMAEQADAKPNPMQKDQFLNLLRTSLNQLT
ncbi:MAG: FAD binding domain-containing protein [Treponema sp.]|nr:FAD binding domain-containing protein [Candidatus Treponema caballi]